MDRMYGFLPRELSAAGLTEVRKAFAGVNGGDDPLEELRATFADEVPPRDLVDRAWERVWEMVYAQRGFPADAQARAAISNAVDEMLLFPARPEGPDNVTLGRLRTAALPANAAAKAQGAALDADLQRLQQQIKALADQFAAERAAKGRPISPLEAHDLARMSPRGQELTRDYRLARLQRDKV